VSLVTARPGAAEPWRDPDAAPLLRIAGVTKRFGDHVAVEDVSLDIHRGEFFALLGGSGSGKSTLLRMLAGLLQPDAGRILLDGQDMAGVPAYQRPVNMMFQSYALFPHMTVAQNIAFGLRMEGASRPAIRDRVAEMLALVRMEGFGDRRPSALSGGQRARIALARALAKRPKLLLLDEPLSALDKNLRESMQFELRSIQGRTGTTCVIVTHDQQEAMTMATRLAVMERGAPAQIGTPGEVYAEPASVFVAGFIGAPPMNLLEIRVEGRRVSIDQTGIELPRAPACQGHVTLGVRAESVRAGESVWTFETEIVEHLGSHQHVHGRLLGQPFVISRPNGGPRVQPGDRFGIHFDAADLHWFGADGRRMPV